MRVNQQSLDGSIVFLETRYNKSNISKYEAAEFL